MKMSNYEWIRCPECRGIVFSKVDNDRFHLYRKDGKIERVWTIVREYVCTACKNGYTEEQLLKEG